jgi:hypothetical protein
MRKSKRIALQAQQAYLKELLERYGIPWAGPDHPVYSMRPSIRIQPPTELPIQNLVEEEEEMSESAKSILKQISSQ